MAENDWLQYDNSGATRSRPLSPKLTRTLGSFLPDMGVTARVFSGGQPSKDEGGPRTGSTRHDHGEAADVFFFKDGRKLDWANAQDLPVFQEIVRRGRSAGLTGFGAGPGYMQAGSMHVGFGEPGVWGAGGSGAAAPEWLSAAFNGTTQGQAPAPAYASQDADPVSVATGVVNPYAVIAGRNNAEDSRAGLMDTFGQAMDRAWIDPGQNMFGYLGSKYLSPQADWTGPSDDDLRTAQARGVDVADTARLVDTWSRDHYDQTIDNILAKRELEKNLIGNGWAGSAVSVGASVFSPEMLAAVGIGIATDGLMVPSLLASRTGALANAARFAASGATGNVIATGALTTARGDEFGGDEAWEALLWGAGIGAVAGAFMSPSLAAEAEQLLKAADGGIRKVVGDAEAVRTRRYGTGPHSRARGRPSGPRGIVGRRGPGPRHARHLRADAPGL